MLQLNIAMSSFPSLPCVRALLSGQCSILKWVNRAEVAAFVICVFDDVVVHAAAFVAVVAADVVVKAVEGGCRGAVAADVVADVEADRPLDNCSAAAAAASDVSIVSTLCNTNECTNAR